MGFWVPPTTPTAHRWAARSGWMSGAPGRRVCHNIVFSPHGTNPYSGIVALEDVRLRPCYETALRRLIGFFSFSKRLVPGWIPLAFSIGGSPADPALRPR